MSLDIVPVPNSGGPRQRTVVMCHGHSKNGKPCMKTGTHEKFGGWFCKTHLSQAAFQRDCAICLCPMDMDTSISLDCCGNAYHKTCLANQTAVGSNFKCAMCRTRIDGTVLARHVHNEYLHDLGKQIFSIRNEALIPRLCLAIQSVITEHNNE